MARQLSISQVHASRSLVAARQSLEGRRASFEYRLGQAFLDWARRPWHIERWRLFWSMWSAAPEVRVHNWYIFWALQIPQELTHRRPADASELEAARRMWSEWLRAEADWNCTVGRGLAHLRRGFRPAYQLVMTAWRSRDHQPGGPLRPAPALAKEGPRPTCGALAPGWLSSWLAPSGAEPLHGERLLLCLGAGLETERVQSALEANPQLTCWVVDSQVKPEWEGWLQRAVRVAAADPLVAQSLASRLERRVDYLPPAVQPRWHNPFGCWHQESRPAEGQPPDGVWSALVRAAQGRARERSEPGEPGLPGHADAERERFLRMRHVLAHHSLDRRLVELGMLPEENPGLATVFCATSRPHQLGWLLERFQAQVYEPKELVLLLHGPGFDPRLVHGMCQERGITSQVLTAPSDVTLGECLQRAVEVARGDYLFKIDDDDWYGSRYLDEGVMALEYSEAGLVSKVSFPLSFRSSPHLWMLRPGSEFRYALFGGGATLGGLRQVFEQVCFRPRRLDEDHAFRFGCLAHSIPMLSTSCYGFVCYRGDSRQHTWRLGDRDLQKVAEPLPGHLRIEDFDL